MGTGGSSGKIDEPWDDQSVDDCTGSTDALRCSPVTGARMKDACPPYSFKSFGRLPRRSASRCAGEISRDDRAVVLGPGRDFAFPDAFQIRLEFFSDTRHVEILVPHGRLFFSNAA